MRAATVGVERIDIRPPKTQKQTRARQVTVCKYGARNIVLRLFSIIARYRRREYMDALREAVSVPVEIGVVGTHTEMRHGLV